MKANQRSARVFFMGFITYLMKNEKMTLLFLIFYQLEFNEEWKEVDLQNTAILERMKKVVSFFPCSFDPKLFSNTCKIANGKEKKATITCSIQWDHVNFQYVFAHRKLQFFKKKKSYSQFILNSLDIWRTWSSITLLCILNLKFSV